MKKTMIIEANKTPREKVSHWDEPSLYNKILIIANNLEKFPKLRLRFSRALYLLLRNSFNNEKVLKLKEFLSKLIDPNLVKEQNEKLSREEIKTRKSKLGDFMPNAFKDKLINVSRNLKKSFDLRHEFAKILADLFKNQNGIPGLEAFKSIMYKTFTPIKNESREFKLRKFIRENVEKQIKLNEQIIKNNKNHDNKSLKVGDKVRFKNIDDLKSDLRCASNEYSEKQFIEKVIKKLSPQSIFTVTRMHPSNNNLVLINSPIIQKIQAPLVWYRDADFIN